MYLQHRFTDRFLRSGPGAFLLTTLSSRCGLRISGRGRLPRGLAVAGLLLAWIGLLSPDFVPSALAQADEASEDEVYGGTLEDEIVITAARIEQSARDVAANVTVVDEGELLSTASVTIDDALRQVPGFSLFRRSSSMVAHPTSQGLSLRGIGPSGVSRTLVLLDGVALNDAFGGWVYWSRVQKGDIDHVEVVRGGGSSVWGNSALGGVVHLFTRAQSGVTANANLRAGDNALLAAEAGFGGEFARGTYSLQGHSFDTDGYRTVRPDQRGPVDIDSYTEHWGVNARAKVEVSESQEISLSLEHFDEERGNGTPLSNNDTQADFLALRGQIGSGRSASWRWSLGYQDQDFASTFSSVADDRASERPALNQYAVPSEAFFGSLQWLANVGDDGNQRLTAGIDARQVEGQTNEQFFYTSQFNAERRAGGEQIVGGLYLQDSFRGQRFRIDFGARVDRFETSDGSRFDFNLADGSTRLDVAYPDRSETEISPRLGFLYELTGTQRLFASAYRSFRAPTVNELYRPFRVGSDITAANPLLVPETLVGVEAGWRYNTSDSRFEATAFSNRIDDAVSNVTVGFGPGVIGSCGFTPGGGTCRQRQNVEEVRVDGLEVEWARSVTDRIKLEASYLYSDSEVREALSSPATVGLRLPQTPEHQYSLRARFEFPVDVALTVRGMSEQYEDDLNQRELSEAVLADLWLGRAVSERWLFFAAVENLFDEEVEAGLRGNGLVTLAAPRFFHVGARLRFSAGN